MLAYDRIHEWAVSVNACEFLASDKPSFVIRVPTRRVPSQILTVQGKELRFYSNHFIGSWKQYHEIDSEQRESIELVGELWQRLANELDWQTMKEPARHFSHFQRQCKEQRPEDAWKSYKGNKEPLIAIRVLSTECELGRFIELLREIFTKRILVSLP